MEPIVIAAHASNVNAIRFSPDGSAIATAGDDQVVREWDTADGTQLREYSGHSRPVNGIVYLSDNIVSAGEDGEIRYWSRGNAEVLRIFDELKKPIETLLITPSEKHLLASTSTDQLVVLDAATGQLLKRVKSTGRGLGLRDVSRLGTRVAIFGAGKHFFLYSIPDASLVTQVLAHEQQVTSFAFCRDSHRALSTCVDGSLKVWDSADWHEVSRMTVGEAGDLKIVVSETGAYAAVSSPGEISIIDLSEMSKLRTISAIGDTVTALAFAPDGTRLAAASHSTAESVAQASIAPTTAAVEGGAGRTGLVRLYSVA